MFLERLMGGGNASLLEQMVKFTQARHNLLADNIVNVSTPNYRQKDISLEKFQAMLSEQLEVKNRDGRTAGDIAEVSTEEAGSESNILFHDRNDRSIEKLMSDQAQNAMMHNLMTELLRKQFTQIQDALRERVS